MSYIHRGFNHPAGGVSPMKQEKVEEEEVEEKKKKKKTFDYSKKQDYSGTTPTSEAITHFVTPQNKLELGLEFAAGGVGVGVGKGVSRLAKTKLGKKLISKVPWLKNLTKPITKGTKGTEKTDFDFSGKHDYSGGGKPKGGVDGGSIKVDKNYKYETFDAKTTPRSVTDATHVKGADIDDFITSTKADGMDFSKMDYSGSITKLPNKSGRQFVKVDLPNGGEQIFYKSSGTGGKAGSKGEWIPFEGFRPGGWFVKTGSKGKFAGKNMETIFTHHNAAGDVISKADWIKQGSQQKLKNSHGVYEQIQKLGLDPWEEISKGTLKIDKWGQGFKYGSKEYTKIAEQLKNMDL